MRPQATIVIAAGLGCLCAWPCARAASGGAQPGAGPAPTCTQKYHTEAKFLANPDESVLLAGVIGWCRNHQTRLLWDERYAVAARRWSRNLVESGIVPDKMIPLDRLRFDLRNQGVTDTRVEPWSAEGPVETVPEGMIRFLDRVATKGRYTHFAVGVERLKNQKKMVSTLLLGRRPALIDPLPVCPAPASRLPLRVRLRRGYRHPSWLMTTPRGNVVRESLLYEEGAWHGTVPLDAGRGVYQLELVVHGPAGPEVAALFPLYAGVERPRVPTVKLRPAPERYRTPEDAERAAARLVNQSRGRHDLPPLERDERISDLAREHALELLARRHAVHRSARTGALQDRLRKAGVPFARALENVSLSSSPETAHERFVQSPGHRINVLDPNVTRLGVGIAMERGAKEDIMAVCEVYVESVEAADLSKTARRLAELINQKRKRRGRFALGLDRDLSRQALRTARRLAAAGGASDPQQASDRLLQELSEGRLEVPEVRVRVLRTTTPRRVLSDPETLAEDINRLGIGVARCGKRSRPDEVWIVVVFAGR